MLNNFRAKFQKANKSLGFDNTNSFNSSKKNQQNHELIDNNLNSKLKKIGLRTKAAIFTVAISTIPVLAIGTINYSLVNQALTKEVSQLQQSEASELTERVNLFFKVRLQELQLLASQDFLSNPVIRNSVAVTAQQLQLSNWQEVSQVYRNITVVNINGDVFLQTQTAVLPNQKSEEYFQAVLKTNKTFISQPSSSNSEDSYIDMAVPVKDTITGKTIFILKASISTKSLKEILHLSELTEVDYHLIDSSGKIFLAVNKSVIGKNIQQVFPIWKQLQSETQPVSRTIPYNNGKSNKFLTYVPWGNKIGNTNLQWKIVLTADKNIAFATQQQLLWTLGIGSLLTIALSTIAALIIAHRYIIRIMAANQTLKRLAKGNLHTRMPLNGKDELTSLGMNINQMAAQLETLLKKQKEEAEEKKRLLEDTQALKNLAMHLCGTWDVRDIYNLAVQDIRQALQADRVVIYKFDENWKGVFLAESVIAGFPCAMGVELNQPCLADYTHKYRDGKVLVINNIHQASLNPCYVQQLETFSVKANLIAPIIVGENLLGLLIAHQCSEPRDWQPLEIDLFEQFARLVGLALERADLLSCTEKARQTAEDLSNEQRQQKELLEQQIIVLLEQIEGAIQGDLTVRAEVEAGEIGTVADFFNAIVENLRLIVTQVKTTANEVNAAIADNSVAITQLATKANEQASEISNTLETVAQMRDSIKTVARSANKTANVTRTAALTAANSSASIDLTVEKIGSLRQTIGETSKKVKRLGEASQQISRVVYLINQISVQTNLLAINAGIEATRNGTDDRGFAAVAEEVAVLANRCTTATTEIETIVANIQRESTEVNTAMESGISQVIEGTRLVENTKESWLKIINVCHKIDDLVHSISTATVSQVQLSQQVSLVMQSAVKASEMTSDSSQYIANSLQKTVNISEKLQESVETFRVG
jgi:methyl-accepting chemotaxis protein PixJ